MPPFLYLFQILQNELPFSITFQLWLLTYPRQNEYT
jgi:hypothetical protein